MLNIKMKPSRGDVFFELERMKDRVIGYNSWSADLARKLARENRKQYGHSNYGKVAKDVLAAEYTDSHQEDSKEKLKILQSFEK